MRIHNLLIAGALAGLMGTAGSMHAQEVKKPPNTEQHMQQPGNGHHKKATKQGAHKQQHNQMKAAKRKTKTEPGSVSKSLMRKPSKSSKNGARSSKHPVSSSNASHHKSGHSTKSGTKSYQ